MIKYIATWPIRLYKMLLSPFLPRACIFQPTCSEYSLIAIEKYGVIKGALLSVKRILRCNPFTTGGYDPVP